MKPFVSINNGFVDTVDFSPRIPSLWNEYERLSHEPLELGEYGLKQRLVTGVIAAFVFLGVLLLGGYAYAALIAALAILGYHEFVRLNKIDGFGSGIYVGYVAVLLFVILSDRIIPGFTIGHDQLIWTTMLVFLALTVFLHSKTNLHKIAILFVGVLYIGYGFHYMLVTRLMPEDGLLWSLFIYGCIWLTDSGAYFTGMLLGRHPLAPSISPKKTIEGAIGGVVIAMLFAVSFVLLSGGPTDIGRAILLAAMIAVIGQIGDLIQSAYKRLQGVKDSGTLLPGHGGVLDRVDSWLIVFPAIHLLGL